MPLYGYTDVPLVGIDAAQTEVLADPDPIDGAKTAWSEIGPSVSRLVGHGPKLYALQNLTF